MKLIMVDLDGTLFDTREVNYKAYKDALNIYGYSLEYDYFCKYCNGKYYIDFLANIVKEEKQIIKSIHDIKKEKYNEYLSLARMNINLVELLKQCKKSTAIALVTTASKANTYEILSKYNIKNLFDLIITGDDVKLSKPNPEGYQKALSFFNVEPQEAVIFEDSLVGIEAAEKCGVQCFVVKGYN